MIKIVLEGADCPLNQILRSAETLLLATAVCQNIPASMDCFLSVIILSILSISLKLTVSDATECNPEIYGPGWDDPELILPARYFFVRFPSGCSKSLSDVSVQSTKADRECVIVRHILTDARDNIVIVRYRLATRMCSHGITITIRNHDGNVIASKSSNGPIRGEKCVCRLDNFAERLGCPKDEVALTGIQRDLQPFLHSHGNFSLWLKDSEHRFASYPRSYSFCRYKIVSNEIYRKCYGEYVGFSQFFDEILKSILRKTSLPDVQLLVNLGDWPLSSSRRDEKPIPMFSWCGSKDTYDIVLPTYEMTESVLQMQGRVSTDILSILGRQSIPWKEKEGKVFFRGRDSNRLRLLLVLYSKEQPELIDAGLTNFFFFREEEDLQKYGPKVPHISLFDFFKYKYLINIDGTVAAYRFASLLAGSSLVLKHQSNYYEHFYHKLQPGTHYIETNHDLTNFHQVIDRLTNRSHPQYITEEEQQEIVSKANDFVLKHLLPSNIYCYYLHAIVQFSELTLGREEIVLLSDDEHIENEGDPSCSCDQHSTLKNKEKDEF